MTKTAANKLMNEIGCKQTIFKILDLLNGESFNDCKNILDLTAFYLKEHSFVDSEMAKNLIEESLVGDDENG